MNTMRVKLSDIAFSKVIWPRAHYYYQVAYRYAASMRAGVKFPPIVVGRIKTAEDPEKLYLVDGLHRMKAYEMLGMDELDAEVHIYDSFEDAFYDAIRRNIAHGQPLTAYEYGDIIRRLLEQGKDWVFIATLLQMTIDDVKKFAEKKLVEVEEGEIEVVKKPVETVKERIVTKEMVKAQEGLTGVPQMKLVNDLITIIDIGLLDVDNKRLMERLRELYKRLKAIFERP